MTKSATQRSAWTVLVWMGAAMACEGLAALVLSWNPPAWLSPIIPAFVALLRAAVVIAKTKSVDVSEYPPELQQRVKELMDALAASQAAGTSTTAGLERRRIDWSGYWRSGGGSL